MPNERKSKNGGGRVENESRRLTWTNFLQKFITGYSKTEGVCDMGRYKDAVDVSPSMTIDEALSRFSRIYTATMTRMEFYDNHRDLAEYSIRHLGGLCRLFEISNVALPGQSGNKVIAGLAVESHKIANKYRANYLSAEGIQREIIRLWYTGCPLNYTAIARKRQGLYKGAKEFFGSWENALKSVGIEYSSVMKGVNSNVLSECGTEFEELFAEILSELGYEYLREGEGVSEVLDEFTLKPDFILPNWRWIDCKLSEWTDASEMLKKYQAMEPNGITIVYLRGKNQRKYRGTKWRYEHVSVYQFTQQLTKDRRKYYEDKLNEISKKADEGAVAK